MNTLVRGIALICCLIVAGCSDPQARKEKHIEDGWTYFNAANFDKARVEFQNALQIDPKDAKARFALGQTFERLGDLRNAMGHYSAATDDPAHVDARVAMARILLLSGNLDLATQRDDEALALAPRHAAALAIRAGIQAASGQKDLAEQTARQALALDPADSGAVSLLASLYMRSARYEEAHALLKGAIAAQPTDIGVRAVYAQVLLEANDVDEAIDQLDAIARLDPNDLGHQARLVNVLASVGRTDEADRRLAKVVDVRHDAQAKLLRVEFLTKFATSETALAALRQYVDADPQDSDLALALAQLLENSGKTAEAEQSYRAIVEADRSDRAISDARVGLASLLVRAQRVGDAKLELAKILDIEPNNTRALVLHGRIALSERQQDQAIADFRTALRDDPNAAPVHALLAAAYQADDQPLMAKETMRSAVQISPADPVLRKQLFGLAMDSREWDLAATQVNALEGLGESKAVLVDLRYRVAMGRGDYADALALATTLTDDDKAKAVGQFYRGAALQGLGDAKQAEAAYRAALVLRPDAEEPLGALVRLMLSEKRNAAAVALLEETIAKSPRNAVAQNLLGELDLGAGRTIDAKVRFEAAIALRDTWWTPYRGLAATQAAQKDLSGAEQTLRRGIERTGQPRLYVELGLLLGNVQRFDDAIALYEQGLQAHPEAAVLANNLAMLLVTERSDAASLERAMALAAGLADSSDPAVLDTVGWVNYKAGRHADAKVYLDRALAKLPSAPLLRYHLAQVLAASGDPAGARAAVTEALKAPAFSEREAAQALNAQLAQNP